MAAKTGKLTANRARKDQFLRRDFRDMALKIGVGDVTSPIVVLNSVLSLHNLLLVFAGLNAPLKKK